MHVCSEYLTETRCHEPDLGDHFLRCPGLLFRAGQQFLVSTPPRLWRVLVVRFLREKGLASVGT